MAKKPQPTAPGTTTTRCDTTCILSSAMRESYELYSATKQWVESGRRAQILPSGTRVSIEEYDLGRVSQGETIILDKAEATELVRFLLRERFVELKDVANIDMALV